MDYGIFINLKPRAFNEQMRASGSNMDASQKHNTMSKKNYMHSKKIYCIWIYTNVYNKNMKTCLKIINTKSFAPR